MQCQCAHALNQTRRKQTPPHPLSICPVNPACQPNRPPRHLDIRPVLIRKRSRVFPASRLAYGQRFVSQLEQRTVTTAKIPYRMSLLRFCGRHTTFWLVQVVSRLIHACPIASVWRGAYRGSQRRTGRPAARAQDGEWRRLRERIRWLSCRLPCSVCFDLVSTEFLCIIMMGWNMVFAGS